MEKLCDSHLIENNCGLIMIRKKCTCIIRAMIKTHKRRIKSIGSLDELTVGEVQSTNLSHHFNLQSKLGQISLNTLVFHCKSQRGSKSYIWLSNYYVSCSNSLDFSMKYKD